jgi:hypothetical protein
MSALYDSGLFDSDDLAEAYPDGFHAVKHTVLLPIWITRSMHISLIGQAAFQKAFYQHGVYHRDSSVSPLDGHLPSLQLTGHTQISSNRAISLPQPVFQVIVDAPLVARGRLRYKDVLDCVASDGSQHSSTDRLITLPRVKLQCACSGGTPMKLLQWTYLVGAYGYAIASGKYLS